MAKDEAELRPALPARYSVAQRGTKDPETAAYYVLDVVHDYQARVMLRGLVRSYRMYGSSALADELEELLDQTNDAFASVVEAANEKLRATTGTRGRSTRRSRR